LIPGGVSVSRENIPACFWGKNQGKNLSVNFLGG
jgi:hypothetical protein